MLRGVYADAAAGVVVFGFALVDCCRRERRMRQDLQIEGRVIVAVRELKLKL